MDADQAEQGLRRMLVATAVVVTVLALLHHTDHVIRGELVSQNGLNDNWNHSGWPFRAKVTPFTFSLGVYAILVPGIILTLRGRAWAGYWLVGSLLLAAVIIIVHFVPGSHTETPWVIYESYEQGSGAALAGVLAVGNVFLILAALAVLFGLALRARRITGRW